MTKAPIPSEKESLETTRRRHKNFDYTIAGRLGSNYRHPYGMVKPVLRIPTFPITANAGKTYGYN